MRITHLLFDEYPYITSWGYQENKMAEAQVQNGDEVTIIAGRYIPRVLEGFLTLDDLDKNVGKDEKGIIIIRLSIGNQRFNKINRKVKFYKNLYSALESAKPEILFVHDIHAMGMFSVKSYMKKHEDTCCCLADVHVTFVNSGTNWISRLLLHGFFYRFIIQRTSDVIKKVFYLDEQCKKFIADEYGFKDEIRLEMLPLGGEIVDQSRQSALRKKFLEQYGLPENTMIFLHSGKINRCKKTLELIRAFKQNQNPSFILIIIGKVADEIEAEFKLLVESDTRISYLGWKTSDELNQYLALADVYLQLGTPSVTAHEAMCKGCATLLNGEAGFYKSFIPHDAAIYVENEEDLEIFFTKTCENAECIRLYKEKGYALAKDIFDYRKQVEKIKKEAIEILKKDNDEK